MIERPRLTLSVSDRILEREIIPDDDPIMADGMEFAAKRGANVWTASSPISGVEIVNSWEIFHRIKLVLTRTEAGHFELARSINSVRFNRVHDHATEIYNVYYIDEGVAVFAATDGWWHTTSTGKTWAELAYAVPGARNMAAVQTGEVEWALLPYSTDKKIYSMVYPFDGAGSEVFDSTSIWTGKWHPAIAGNVVCVLAGVGPYLIRSEDLGETWSVIQTFGESEIIKSITVSTRSNMPTFLIETDTDGICKFYWSEDAGDSLVLNETRFEAISDVQSVIPTSKEDEAPMFVILGKRSQDSPSEYKIVRR